MANAISLPAAWDAASAKSWASIKRMAPFDAAALLLIDPARPDPEGVLGVRGLTGKQVAGWLDANASGDALLRKAAKDARAVSDKALSSSSACLPKGMRAAVVASRCAPGSKRYWVLAVGRRKGAYAQAEVSALGLALMAIQSRFDTVPHDDPGLQRVLADADGRVMHADTESRLAHGGDLAGVQELIDTILEIETQRWPEGTSDQPHDLFPPHGRGPSLWARVTHLPDKGRGLPGATYVEVRPIEGLAPPGVGRVEDDRVAQAMGLMADQFADTLSLNDVSEHFEVSPFHFHRLFNTQAQISPKHFNLRVQLLHSRHLLRTTRLPIREVAEACGFTSHGHFTATFHRMVGLTPLDFRLGVQPPSGR